jgi:hypothetical protein
MVQSRFWSWNENCCEDGNEFHRHSAAFKPTFAKGQVHCNSKGDIDLNRRQG